MLGVYSWQAYRSAKGVWTIEIRWTYDPKDPDVLAESIDVTVSRERDMRRMAQAYLRLYRIRVGQEP